MKKTKLFGILALLSALTLTGYAADTIDDPAMAEDSIDNPLETAKENPEGKMFNLETTTMVRFKKHWPEWDNKAFNKIITPTSSYTIEALEPQFSWVADLLKGKFTFNFDKNIDVQVPFYTRCLFAYPTETDTKKSIIDKVLKNAAGAYIAWNALDWLKFGAKGTLDDENTAVSFSHVLATSEGENVDSAKLAVESLKWSAGLFAKFDFKLTEHLTLGPQILVKGKKGNRSAVATMMSKGEAFVGSIDLSLLLLNFNYELVKDLTFTFDIKRLNVEKLFASKDYIDSQKGAGSGFLFNAEAVTAIKYNVMDIIEAGLPLSGAISGEYLTPEEVKGNFFRAFGHIRPYIKAEFELTEEFSIIANTVLDAEMVRHDRNQIDTTGTTAWFNDINWISGAGFKFYL